MKWIQSPGIKTDMIFHHFDAMVQDRGTYVAVKTPGNPNFYYGNLLLFPEAPRPGSLQRWESLFREEFESLPAIRHRAFLWDAPAEGRGYVYELSSAQYILDESVILAASSVVRPVKVHPSIIVRPLRSEDEWMQATRNQFLAWAEHSHGEDGWAFKVSQMNRYRAMTTKGMGLWFGAFLRDKLVADLGIYTNASLGRFQNVSTHPDFRRQGICGGLVYESAEYALREMSVTQLVMVADANYHAARIYESVGFSAVAREFSAYLPPGK